MDKFKKDVYDLCLYILASAYLDWEVNLAGNGTNAFEAANVAHQLLEMMGQKISKKEIELKAVELKIEMFGEDEGETKHD